MDDVTLERAPKALAAKRIHYVLRCVTALHFDPGRVVNLLWLLLCMVAVTICLIPEITVIYVASSMNITVETRKNSKFQKFKD